MAAMMFVGKANDCVKSGISLTTGPEYGALAANTRSLGPVLKDDPVLKLPLAMPTNNIEAIFSSSNECRVSIEFFSKDGGYSVSR